MKLLWISVHKPPTYSKLSLSGYIGFSGTPCIDRPLFVDDWDVESSLSTDFFFFKLSGDVSGVLDSSSCTNQLEINTK